jgi:hypothetical protein
LTTRLALLSHQNGAVSWNSAKMARASRRGAARGLHACYIVIRYVGSVGFQVRNKIIFALSDVLPNQTINKMPIAWNIVFLPSPSKAGHYI